MANGPKALFAGGSRAKAQLFGKLSVHLKKNKNRLPARTYAGRANTLQHKRGDCVRSAQSFPCAPERRTEENNERQRRTKRLVFS